MRAAIASFCLLALTACSGTIERVTVITEVTSDLRLRANVSTVMVRDVSLPSYAAEEDIYVQDADGVLRTSGNVLWADDPGRAATLAVTGHLNDILTATVAPEPWPLDGFPSVAVDVRVTRMVAGPDGQFRLGGQYFIGADDQPFRDVSERFAISVPIEGGLGGVPRAQSQAILELAEQIARDLS